ncbi:MFS general substrate transporter [Pleurostoma richardsiae]|uniref:MFS general substrate transporter n=1 Tax=Pleurostoma richardsiae TaxID=41990 RepID=A0AA38RI82_9PEZI|nr:MFS general substrate transporter [Pleurostoma richardsiae]
MSSPTLAPGPLGKPSIRGDSRSNSQEDIRRTYSKHDSREVRTSKRIAESDKELELGLDGREEDSSDTSDADCSPDEAPDGGFEAWTVVLGGWCASFCGYGWINSIGTFQEYYQNGPLKEYSASEISWIPSLQIFFMSILGPVIGRIYDRYGLRVLVGVGSFMHVFGLMMASLSTQYYQFLLSQGVCSAIGVAAVFVCALSTIPGWFTRRRGLAYGVLSTGSSLGGVVFPIMISRLIKTVGYGWAMRAAAFIILGLLVVANLTLKTRLPPTETKLSRELMARPFREPSFVVLLAGLTLIPFGLYIPIDYMPVAAIAAGMSKDMSQNLVAFYNAASMVGRLSSGYLSDRLGKFNMFITACYIAGILILAMWIPGSSIAAVIAFSVLYGLSSGAYISLMAPLVAQISPPQEVGYRNGLTFLVSAVGGLTTSPIAGAIMNGPGGWVGLKAFAGALLVAGTTGVLLCRVMRTGFKLLVAF